MNQHIDKMREEFEAEAVKYWKPKPDFALRDDGVYFDEEIGNAYYFWQISATRYQTERRKSMKKTIAYILSWAFFWLGHASSKLSIGWAAYVFGFLYQKFMSASGRIQEWGGAGAWRDVE